MLVTEMMKEHFARIVDEQFTADMEENLDRVEEEGVDWHGVIADFYGPFGKELEEAEKTIEKVEVQDEVSDVPCEKCGAMMVYKMGRFGRFLACPNFPACRNTQPIVERVAAHCPKCGAGVIKRFSRKGRVFFGCERYPDCDYTSWELPVDDLCPLCGSHMVRKFDRKRDCPYNLCLNENCKHRVELETEEEA